MLDGTQSLRRHTSAVLYTTVPVASLFVFFRAMADGAVAFAVFLAAASAVSVVLGLVVAWRDRLIIRQRLALEDFAVELSQATPPVLSFVVEPNRDLNLNRAYLVVECYERHHDNAWSRFRNRFSRFAYPADVTSTATIELDLPKQIPGMERTTFDVPLTLPRDAPFTIRRFPGTNARWRGRLVLETEELETIEGPFDFQVILPRLLAGSTNPGDKSRLLTE